MKNRNKYDVSWTLPGQKRPFGGSTVATSDLIVMLSDDKKTVKTVKADTTKTTKKTGTKNSTRNTNNSKTKTSSTSKKTTNTETKNKSKKEVSNND